MKFNLGPEVAFRLITREAGRAARITASVRDNARKPRAVSPAKDAIFLLAYRCNV
jgi:hypothetical protein